jgi:hypothetical protein
VKLDDFERTGGGRRTRYVVPLRDSGAGQTYELILAGEGKLVRRVFKEAELEVDIQQKVSDEAWKEELNRAHEFERQASDERGRLEDTVSLLKEAPRPPSGEDSVFASLHTTAEAGTTFSVSATNFFVPSGFRVFFALPPVCDCIGVVRPSSGDQDLFVRGNFPFFGPLLGSSIAAGTAVDTVIVIQLGCTLFSQFMPWFEVFGFSAGSCASFTASGRDVFG